MLASSVAAFTPNAVPRTMFGVRQVNVLAPIVNSGTRLFSDVGIYDGKIWDFEAKKAVYDSWNPTAPRSPLNFNPFETWDGNSPDCSGYYPGESRYKDPLRGDVNFASMMVERAALEEIAANPKPGSGKGCPGCRS
jgi:hypothetical protein